MKERPHSIIFSSSTTTATMASATVTTPSTTNIEATTFPHMGERFAHRGDGCNRNGGNGVGRTTNIPSNASYPHVTATTTNNNNNIGTNGTYNGHLKHKHVLAEIHSYSGDNWRAYAFISFVAIVCYLNGMNGEFVHDDIPAITLNRDVLGTNKISRVFKNDFWGTPMADANSHKSYRPLTVLSFRLNYGFFGLNPVWFHLTNIVLHAIVCILFTRVCIVVAGLQDNFAIIAGIIFAVHPIHTEAVTGIVGRADVLACIFFLISLLIYHGRVEQPNNIAIWLSIFFGGISMLSKETGITVFLLNITYDLYRCWPLLLKRSVCDTSTHWTQKSQQFYQRLTKVLLSMSVLLAIRLALLQGSFPKFSQQDNPTAFHPNLYVRMLTFCYLAAFNWWLILCPSTLSHDWQMGSIPLLTSIQDPRNLLTILAFVTVLLLFHKSILDFETHRYAPLVLGFLLLILPFLPATNLFVTVGFVVAERVLYIPSLGCVLLVVYGAQLLWESTSKYRSVIILMSILLILVGTCKTISRNRDWYSREYLLRAGLKVLPHNAKMHYNFGNFLRDSSKHETASLHYREALRLWPSYASAHNNLGTLVNSVESAEHHFLSAILYSSEHINAHFNLGQLYLRNNRSDEAEHVLKRCISLDPSYIPAYLELYKLYDGFKAGRILRDAIKLNPNDDKLRTHFGYWLMQKGIIVGAVKQFESVLSLDKTHRLAFAGICRCLRIMGQLSRLNLFTSRWKLWFRIANGGILYDIDIFWRDWSIRSELQHKAYIYTVGIRSAQFDQTTRTPSSLFMHNNPNRIKFRQYRNSFYQQQFCNKSKKHILFAHSNVRKTTDITCNKSSAIKKQTRRKHKNNMNNNNNDNNINNNKMPKVKTDNTILVPRIFVTNILDTI